MPILNISLDLPPFANQQKVIERFRSDLVRLSQNGYIPENGQVTGPGLSYSWEIQHERRHWLRRFWDYHHIEILDGPKSS